MRTSLVLLLLASLLLIGCRRESDSQGADSGQRPGETGEEAPPARILPTLYPTATIYPTPEATNTRQPSQPTPSDTPVAYDQLVVELNYAIPEIGLTRSLRGDVSGHVELTDEATGLVVERSNQAGVLIEMQQSLPRLSLEQIPDGCSGCVMLSYNLPLTGQQDEGWLQDVRMLASIENFTTAILGPHFPTDTIAALRRSATPYVAAHTLTVSSDGLLWAWGATEAEIAPAIPLAEGDPLLAAISSGVDVEGLSPVYSATCPQGAGIETLYLRTSEGDNYIQLVCPELALPSTLLPVYLAFDAKSAPLVAELSQDMPSPVLPVEALLFYQNSAGTELTWFHDGRSFIGDESGVIVSGTMTVTEIVSVTNGLLETGLMNSGVNAFLVDSTANVLLVRGPGGLSEVAWQGEPDPLLQPFLQRLEELINRSLESIE